MIVPIPPQYPFFYTNSVSLPWRAAPTAAATPEGPPPATRTSTSYIIVSIVTIIASATPERIGDFHLCAYEIIEQGQNISITEKPGRDLIGVNAPGVNMRLVCNNETIGVIGVTGEPDKILSLARMVKLTFETMYEYEYKM